VNLREWALSQGIHPQTAYRSYRQGKLPVPAQNDASWFPRRASPWVEGGAMTTHPRERDGQRARERPVVAERHRRRERARRAPRRPTCRRDRERGRSDLPGGTPARLRGGVAPEWVERPTSTRVDPGVTSSETARIRDREREPGAPSSERDPDVRPRRSSRPQRAPATSLARFRAPGAPPSPSAARSGDPHTDFEAASRHPSA